MAEQNVHCSAVSTSTHATRIGDRRVTDDYEPKSETTEHWTTTFDGATSGLFSYEYFAISLTKRSPLVSDCYFSFPMFENWSMPHQEQRIDEVVDD
jgi:hypothetical protein